MVVKLKGIGVVVLLNSFTIGVPTEATFPFSFRIGWALNELKDFFSSSMICKSSDHNLENFHDKTTTLKSPPQ